MNCKGYLILKKFFRNVDVNFLIANGHFSSSQVSFIIFTIICQSLINIFIFMLINLIITFFAIITKLFLKQLNQVITDLIKFKFKFHIYILIATFFYEIQFCLLLITLLPLIILRLKCVMHFAGTWPLLGFLKVKHTIVIACLNVDLI